MFFIVQNIKCRQWTVLYFRRSPARDWRRKGRDEGRINGRSFQRGNELRVDNVHEPLSSPTCLDFTSTYCTYTAPDFGHPSFEYLLLLTVFIYATDGESRKGSRLTPPPDRIFFFCILFLVIKGVNLEMTCLTGFLACNWLHVLDT